MGCRASYVPLGEIAKFESGGTPSKKNKKYWNGSIPWISAKTLVGDTVYESDFAITKEGLEAGSKLAPKGSLLLLTRGSGLFKRIPLAIAGKEVAFNQDIKCVNSAAKGISNRYLFYALTSLEPSISAMLETTGIGAGKLATDRLKALPVPVLDEAARDKVTHFADCIYRKIHLNTKLNDYLAELASVIFRKELENLPTSEVLLSDVATVKYGKGLASKNLLEDGYPVFGGNGQIGFYSSYLYEEPQILISCRGAASGNILISLPKSFVTSNSLVVELEDRRYFEWLKQYFLANQLHGFTTGSAQPQITIDSLKFLTVPYPKYSAISSTVGQLKLISDLIYSLNIENVKLGQLRDTLLPRLMAGEIDVSKVVI